MKRKNKKKFETDMSLDFTDALSRREQNKIKKEKKMKEKELDELVKQKTELALKLTGVEEKTRENIYRRENNNLKVEKKQKPKKKNTGLNLFMLLLVIFSISFLGYSVYVAQNKIDNIFTITNASLISLTIILFVICNSINKKYRKGMIFLTGLSFISLITLHVGTNLEFFTLPTQPVVADLTTKTVNEAMKWAAENDIHLSETKEYSETIPKNQIISQDVEPNTLLKKVDTIEIISSEGVNPEATVEIQDMIGWDVDKVVKEIKELKLSKVNIEFEFSTIERDILFEQSKTGKIHRNEELNLKFSLGLEEDLLPVELIDLIKKDEFDATLWLKRNGIKYEIKYEFSDSIEKGKVISTDPKKGTTINQKEQSVTLVISKGPKIVVPDLMNMSLEEIAEWAIKNNINISYNSEYDSEVKEGKIKAVSHKKGDVVEEGSIIYITTSKGTLKMIDYNENDLEKIRTFASTYKITLNETNEYSDTVEKGKIISVSHKKGDVVNSGDIIEVIVSLGKSLQVPDFTGMTLSNAQALCNSSSLTCSTVYVNSTKTKNTVTGQNKRAGSKVIEGTNVVLYVSNGVAPSSGSSSSSNNNNNNSWIGGNSSSGGNSGSGETTPNPDPPISNTFNNIFIQPGWLTTSASSTASKISSSIKSQTSQNVHFTFCTKESVEGRITGHIHESSSYQINKSYSFTENKTYKFIIVDNENPDECFSY